jgi:hypothetical protein
MPCRPLRPVLALLLAALAIAAIAAGCAPQSSSSSNDTDKFKGAQKDVAQAVEDLESAANKSDQGKICRELISSAFRAKLSAHGACTTVVDGAVKDADSVGMTVDQVRIDGDKATARVTFETGKKDRTGTIPLVREGGRWRIDTLGPTGAGA